MSKRALFLYISLSSGHQRAADAVREALAVLAPQVEASGVDTITYAYPTVGRLLARTYLEMLQRTPILWDYLYDNPDVEEATRELRELLNLMNARKVRQLMKEFNPSALICTQAVPCSVLAAEKRRGRVSVPLLAIVTDYAVHAYWIYKEVDLYMVASEETRRELIERGVRPGRIVVTGIPISPSMLRVIPKGEARARLRLDPDRPTLLLMGGSQGLGPYQDLLDELRSLPSQMIVVAGLNRPLFRELRHRFARDRRARILGYTRDMSALMDAADLLITKPGGLTSSEALAKGLPMIITHPIPGQEERNARFLLKHRVAERADSPEEVVQRVREILFHPARLKRMQMQTREQAKPHAAFEVASHLLAAMREPTLSAWLPSPASSIANLSNP